MIRIASRAVSIRPLIGLSLVRNVRRIASGSARQWSWSSSYYRWKLAAMAFAASSLSAHTAYCDRKVDRRFLSECDELYTKGEYEKLKESLEKRGSADVEVLWRLARAMHGVADKSGPRDQKEQERLVEEALAVSERALEAGGDCSAAHKWYGILLNRLGDFKGTKAQIQNSFVVRDHWVRAVELDPADATSRSLLGEWCMAVAGLSFVTRQVAAAVFASPPTATYGEALSHFEEAEKTSPGFWLKNRLNIAKCALRVGDKAKAKERLEEVVAATARSSEDEDVVKEAREALKKMG
uniref:Regulator of microtubule dynamics protein 1 n=1 Tax=Hemiselmis andersenii TaxID=464988 RepID=A0A7S1EBK5_HEMAN|mmetsp:Transcript_4339/g.10503  ORF Transcript_4339/g.10503 Transcript_4339/m.10503 type:complete len:296 (+) Transcript_4339:34-921(+)